MPSIDRPSPSTQVHLHRIVAALIIVLAAGPLAACSERPPRADPEGGPAYSNETPQNPRYERTLEQGEAERMRGG